MKWRIEERWAKDCVEMEGSAGIATSGGARIDVSIDGQTRSAFVSRRKEWIQVWLKGRLFEFRLTSPEEQHRQNLKKSTVDSENVLVAKMPGRILKICVKKGDQVEKGQTLVILEAMKMENHLHLSFPATIEEVLVETNQAVESGLTLLRLRTE